MQTPHGMYPLRFFFSNELATTRGDAVSAKQVKNLIQEMVEAEVPAKPLSDQAISNSLKTKGILLARGEPFRNIAMNWAFQHHVKGLLPAQVLASINLRFQERK